MTKKELKEYSVRITQSTKTGLVVITYEIILNYLQTGKAAFEKGEIKDFVFNVNKAKQFVNNLSGCLDFKYTISKELFEIYLFINRTLSECVVKKDGSKVQNIIGIIEKLKTAFAEVGKNEKTGPVMENTEKIYAGLTYSKGKLNEITLR